ncbi:hypothetical protein KL906_002404 [Ogataea polymorpha]|uniref:Karyogamy protein n=1 Tax=Ogataea polymorpha TaxID=460523 RepID=A0A9P8PSS5_9ASCO|nr:hypothetical protein KL906_002404 [Ogataea polymorpha]KAG7917170.1 hypothetical protein KL927_002944 [Ogataea polymorpha]KAG7936271.1 hypothetical protein KL934_001738 [Ogataea polymorpha]KAH3676649.1 hypothetical protein OGATHE_001138 [Ogataea polymorpha]
MKRLDQLEKCCGGVQELQIEEIALYDGAQVEAAADCIRLFIHEFLAVNDTLSTLSAIAQNKDILTKVDECIHKIDEILPALVTAIESNLESEPGLETTLSQLEPLCEDLLRAKKHISAYLENLHVAVRFTELDEQVLGSISNEIADCSKDMRILQQMLLTTPVKKLPKLELEEINAKMTQSETFRLRMPTFTCLDERLLGLYQQLEGRIDPIQAAVLIVPQTLESYGEVAMHKSPGSIMHLISKYEGLVQNVHELKSALKRISSELVDRRWKHIFQSLMREVSQALEDLEDEMLVKHCLGPSSVRELETVGQSLGILKRAVGERLISEKDMIEKKNELEAQYVKLQEQHFESKRSSPCSPISSAPVKFKGSLFDALQLKPVLIEYNPTSAKKRSPLKFDILEDDESEVSFTTASGSSVLKRLMNEAEDKENETSRNTDENLVGKLQQLDIKERSPRSIRSLSQSDPFITPNAKLHRPSIQKQTEKTKLLKYVPLPVPLPTTRDETLRRQVEPSKSHLTRIPLPMRPESRQSLLNSIIKGEHYTKPPMRSSSCIPRLTLLNKIHSTPLRTSTRPLSALDIHKSPTMMIQPTPLRVIKQRARATSSL